MSPVVLLLILCFNLLESADPCLNIDSQSNKILETDILGEFYLETDDGYIDASKQWSYPSHKDKIHPSIIIYPKSDDDIFIIIRFATLCNYKIVIRSGGHQYNALSSCDSNIYKCIQIDMKYYNTKKIFIENQTLEIGPGVLLGEMNRFLDENGYFLPGGEHTGIGIGGHILTGGEGILAKSHGLMGDFVESFDIILSNATKIENVKYSQDKTKELYWAILGGSPGSFGIITKYTMDLSKTNNEYYKQSMVFCYLFKYSKELMFIFGDLFVKIHEDDVNYLENDNIGSFSLSLMYDFEINDYVIKIAWIWIGNKDGNKNNERQYLSNLFLNGAKKISIEPLKRIEKKESISKLLIEMSQDYGDIAPMPYLIRSYGIQENIDDEFIDLLHDRIELVYRKYGHPSESGMILTIILASFANGKIYTNDPLMIKTSYPFRSQFIAFPIFMFYNNSIHPNAGKMSEKWLDDTMEILMLTKPFNYGKDHYRDISITFGDIDINNVWNYYYHNKTAFERLKHLKFKYDPIDLFHTPFTIPLPTNVDQENKQDL